MRLIDADACPKLFNEEYLNTMEMIRHGQDHLDHLSEGFLEAISVIRNMPTIDPESLRPQGKWIPYHEADFGWDEYGCYCSRCKWKVEDDDIRFSMDYCPNCGAKMK